MTDIASPVTTLATAISSNMGDDDDDDDDEHDEDDEGESSGLVLGIGAVAVVAAIGGMMAFRQRRLGEGPEEKPE